jgi:uncharacterized protein (TIGR02246 family)
MKKFFLLSVVATLVAFSSCKNQNASADLEKRVQLIEDRAAIKYVVDHFSTLADVKDVDAQLELFTEDAQVISENNGNTSAMKGREEIGNAFRNFLALFDVVYHINGQQTVNIDGDKADGINYCQVVMIRTNEDGKRIKQTMGVRYHDYFVKHDGKWLINERHSDFMWTTFDEIQ